MTTRRLGRSDLFVSPITLGTMTFGEQNSEAEAFEQMDRALDFGIKMYDMAEIYPVPPKAETQGRNEIIVGNWLKSRKARDKILVATKVAGRSGMNWLRGDGSASRVTRAQVKEAVEASLRRLQVDVIDLYQLHFPERNVPNFGSIPSRYTVIPQAADETPIEESITFFADLVKEGKIRHLGLSNETPWGAMRWVAAAEKGLGPRPVSIQNAYHFLNRLYETGLGEVGEREDIGLLAYSPLAQGYLTGKYQKGALPIGSRKQLYNRLQRYETPGADVAIDAYLKVAGDFGIDPTVFAVAFTLNQPCCTSSIIGATRMDQLETCLKAANLTWTTEMQAAVDAVHQRVGNPCP